MSEIDQKASDAALAVTALTSLSDPVSSVTPNPPAQVKKEPNQVESTSNETGNQQPASPSNESTNAESLNRPSIDNIVNTSTSSPPISSPQLKSPSHTTDNTSNDGSLDGKKDSVSRLQADLLEQPSKDTTPPAASPASSPSSASKSKPSRKKLTRKVVTFNESEKDGNDSEPEIYSIDAGVIRCICGYIEDDGFTIQCEKCNAWQHAVCVNIKNDQVPEVYLCDKCGHLTYDIEAAKRYQSRRLRSISAQAGLGNSIEADSLRNKKRGLPEYTEETSDHEEVQASKRRRNNNEEKDNKRSSDRAPSAGTSPKVSSSRASPSSVASTSSTNQSSTATTTRKGRNKRLTVSTVLAAKEEENDNEPEKKFTLAEMYSSYFVPIKENRYATPKIRQYVNDLISNPDIDKNLFKHYTSTEFQNISRPELSIKLTSDHPKQKFSGFSRFGLFTESPVVKDGLVTEYIGQIMSLEQYKSHPVNQYRQFGCPKPGVLFHPSIPLCIDGRLVGSQSRFIRQSCKPNCEVRTVVIDDTKIQFAAYSLEAIKPGSEVTIAWGWDPKHPVWKLIDGVSADDLSKPEKLFLEHVANMTNQRGAECACNLPSGDCILNKMKRLGGAPPRNTRIGKSRRGADSGGLEPLESDSTGVYGTEISDSGSFYSKREARKLQSAMDLIERVSKSENKKHKAKDVKVEIPEPEEKPKPVEKPKKPQVQFADKSTQTPKITTPLRWYSTPREKSVVNGDPGARKISRLHLHKRILYQYVKGKKAYLQRPKSESASSVYAALQLKNGVSNSGTLSLKSPISVIPSRSVSGSKPTPTLNGSSGTGNHTNGSTTVTPNVSSPSSPRIPHGEPLPTTTKVASKPATPIGDSPRLTPSSTPTTDSIPSTNGQHSSIASGVASTGSVVNDKKPTVLPVTLTGSTVTTSTNTTAPPTTTVKTVKKLSFADYKKKKTNSVQPPKQ